MRFNFRTKRNSVFKNAVVSIVTICLILTVVIPTINSQVIRLNNENLNSYIKNLNPLCDYTLTIYIIENGTVNKNPDKPKYSPGTVVTLTAYPDAGWTFSHWSGDLSGSNNPENIIIDDNKTVTAHFSINEFTITINIEGEGKVIKNPDYATYPNGTIVKLTAIPDQGWLFSHWSGDISGTGNPKEILIDGNKVVNAHFIKDSIPPFLKITKPINAIYFMDRELVPFLLPIILNEITIQANAYDNETGIERVEFYIDGNLKETVTELPYEYLWDEKITNKHIIEVKAYDYAGNSVSQEIEIIKGIVKHPVLVRARALILYLIYLIRND